MVFCGAYLAWALDALGARWSRDRSRRRRDPAARAAFFGRAPLAARAPPVELRSPSAAHLFVYSQALTQLAAAAAAYRHSTMIAIQRVAGRQAAAAPTSTETTTATRRAKLAADDGRPAGGCLSAAGHQARRHNERRPLTTSTMQTTTTTRSRLSGGAETATPTLAFAPTLAPPPPPPPPQLAELSRPQVRPQVRPDAAATWPRPEPNIDQMTSNTFDHFQVGPPLETLRCPLSGRQAPGKTQDLNAPHRCLRAPSALKMVLCAALLSALSPQTGECPDRLASLAP